ncbi:MAG TPA: dethiobiotin synthase [Acidimicrobiales bacterium]|nr:dethiobiotin synthase [Acidimicrobiales bacterium]
MRPDRLVVVLGTATGVGKTWTSCALARHLRAAGTGVVARKPAQSYDPGDASPTDAHLLGAACGEPPERVTPAHRWYPVPLAPPMAADTLGRAPFSISQLVDELAAGWGPRVDVGIVETAGGACSPLADDGDCVAFTAAVGADDVVLVADAGLGTLNAVRATVHALGRAPLVFLNHFDATSPHDLHARNARWLRERDALDVVTSTDALAARLSSAP